MRLWQQLNYQHVHSRCINRPETIAMKMGSRIWRLRKTGTSSWTDQCVALEILFSFYLCCSLNLVAPSEAERFSEKLEAWTLLQVLRAQIWQRAKPAAIFGERPWCRSDTRYVRVSLAALIVGEIRWRYIKHNVRHQAQLLICDFTLVCSVLLHLSLLETKLWLEVLSATGHSTRQCCWGVFILCSHYVYINDCWSFNLTWFKRSRRICVLRKDSRTALTHKARHHNILTIEIMSAYRYDLRQVSE